MTQQYYAYADSPLGELLFTTDGKHLTGLFLPPNVELHEVGLPADEDSEIVEEVRKQLDSYFAGELREFDLPLKMEGTSFQKRVWEELTRIPFGETISYGEQARRAGRPDASRAVGAANGRNPIPIIVPCHRVIGAKGALTGYGGGLEVKHWLLQHEQSVLTGNLPLYRMLDLV